MFGDALPEEVLTIATDLDMTGAQERWAEFAENPGAITTDAVIAGYSEAEDAQKLQPQVEAFIAKYTEIPEGANKAELTPEGLIAYINTYAEVTGGADVSGLTPENVTAMPFGWGDGGGGPTKEMLEAYPCVKSMPGLPDVEMKTVTRFFDELDSRLEGKRTPVWDGELYFEYHRGTYTSQAFIKAANRRAETALHNIEWLHALGDLALDERRYPAERLTQIWKRLCVNQFHDIIPGSSIREVYDDAREDHRWIAREASELLRRGVARLTSRIDAPVASAVVLNPLGWARGGVVEIALPEGRTLAWRGEPLPCQSIERGGVKTTLVRLPDIPAMGWRALPISPAGQYTATARPLERGIETERYRIRWNGHGQLCELYDRKNGRQLLKENAVGNELQVFEDRPHAFSAWNTEAYAFGKVAPVTQLESAELIENGAVQASVRFAWRFHLSRIEQTMTVYRDSDGIRFDTLCDWRESDTLMKTCFPLEIRGTTATYDIQFGDVERATHENTSWQTAQFEVCAHKWMDLSEGDYGVSMLNDCKYGCDVKDGNMRLSLIKAPTYPDERADIGEHRFAYCLLPHAGTWREANIPRAAYAFNSPLLVDPVEARAGTLPGEGSLLTVDAPDVIVETVKQAQDGNGLIVRLYENQGCRRRAMLRLGFAACRAWETDLLENAAGELGVADQRIELSFTPYEIKTILIQ